MINRLRWTQNISLAVGVVIALSLSVNQASAQLLNSSFEAQDATVMDVPLTTNWNTFGNGVFVVNPANGGNSPTAFAGVNSVKTFAFGFAGAGAGATQTVAASAGQTWVGEIYAQNFSGDPLDSVDFGVYKIEFLDAGLNFVAGGIAGIDVFESNMITGATPQDTWTLLGVGTAPAPVGTAFARAVFVGVNLDDAGTAGVVFWDKASLSAIPEPGSLALLRTYHSWFDCSSTTQLRLVKFCDLNRKPGTCCRAFLIGGGAASDDDANALQALAVL